MGLNLQGYHVTIDHSHRHWLITTPEGNPTRERVGNLTIYSMFRRQKAPASLNRDRKQRKLGDNCPLIYALKGKEGLTTDFSSIKALSQSFNAILEAIAQAEPDGYDLIVSMLSAHNISHIVGKRFSRYFNAPHFKDLLRKITVEEAFILLDRANIDVTDVKSLQYQLRRQKNEVGYQGAFSLKGIPTEHRAVFPPITINTALTMHLNAHRILITDDLLATGTTLETAASLLGTLCPGASVQAACLFSSMGRLTRGTLKKRKFRG